eukprot:TRINITY_DN39321_c0_g1_i14.p2 TRINITY_DN39321_c0_g1~~TRINITY_DN39321_c0_g1_i14.p2  ORF type:complete len:134 (+),score=8.22 TRINITY_DN39321_c0_g1_i14:111-512(+)
MLTMYYPPFRQSKQPTLPSPTNRDISSPTLSCTPSINERTFSLNPTCSCNLLLVNVIIFFIHVELVQDARELDSFQRRHQIENDSGMERLIVRFKLLCMMRIDPKEKKRKENKDALGERKSRRNSIKKNRQNA